MKPNFDDVLNVEGLDDEELLTDIKNLIRQADSLKPRSLQKALGPSEVGHPCTRKLAHGTVNATRHALAAENGAWTKPTALEEGLNRFNDPWAAIMGTAAHAWLEDAVKRDNVQRGRVRWISEQEVYVDPRRPKLRGTCDLYDVDTASVLDWKVPGKTRHDKYKKHGPSVTYRAQAHLYGSGYRQLGLPVEKVGIVFLSRSGGLRDAFLWREDYSQELVDGVLTHLESVDQYIEELNLLTTPANFPQVPMVPTDDCYLCPFYSPGAGLTEPFKCPGKAPA